MDDEPPIRDLLREMLEEMGYACHVAASGEEALRTLATEPVDIALVDILMPGISGLELFREIGRRHPQVGVVFITAMQDLGTAVESMRLGACDYLTKPIRLRELARRMEAALEVRRKRIEEHQRLKSLEAEVASKAEDLERRSQELTALNRLFQTHLSEPATLVEIERQQPPDGAASPESPTGG